MSSSEPLLPYIFPTSGGENISPHQVNENAWALYDAAVRAMANRYNYFPVVLDLNELAANESAVEGQWIIDAPFSYEVTGAELTVYGDDDGTPSSGTDSITLTCSASGWNTLTATADHASPNTAGRDFLNQSLRVAADTEVTWTISLPTTGNAKVRARAILYCRHDCIAEAGLSVSDLAVPPQVKDGDTYDITEWNTWFSAFAADLTSLAAALSQRRRFAVFDLGRSESIPIATDDPYAYMALPGFVDEFVEQVNSYANKSVTGTDSVTVTIQNTDAATTVYTGTISMTAADTWFSDEDADIQEQPSGSRVTQDLDIYIESADTASLSRCYAVVSFRRV